MNNSSSAAAAASFPQELNLLSSVVNLTLQEEDISLECTTRVASILSSLSVLSKVGESRMARKFYNKTISICKNSDNTINNAVVGHPLLLLILQEAPVNTLLQLNIVTSFVKQQLLLSFDDNSNTTALILQAILDRLIAVSDNSIRTELQQAFFDQSNSNNNTNIIKKALLMNNNSQLKCKIAIVFPGLVKKYQARLLKEALSQYLHSESSPELLLNWIKCLNNITTTDDDDNDNSIVKSIQILLDTFVYGKASTNTTNSTTNILESIVSDSIENLVVTHRHSTSEFLTRTVSRLFQLVESSSSSLPLLQLCFTILNTRSEEVGRSSAISDSSTSGLSPVLLYECLNDLHNSALGVIQRIISKKNSNNNIRLKSFISKSLLQVFHSIKDDKLQLKVAYCLSCNNDSIPSSSVLKFVLSMVKRTEKKRKRSKESSLALETLFNIQSNNGVLCPEDRNLVTSTLLSSSINTTEEEEDNSLLCGNLYLACTKRFKNGSVPMIPSRVYKYISDVSNTSSIVKAALETVIHPRGPVLHIPPAFNPVLKNDDSMSRTTSDDLCPRYSNENADADWDTSTKPPNVVISTRTIGTNTTTSSSTDEKSAKEESSVGVEKSPVSVEKESSSSSEMIEDVCTPPHVESSKEIVDNTLTNQEEDCDDEFPDIV